ncbi:multidrug resistance protein 1 [Amanita muscaria]
MGGASRPVSAATTISEKPKRNSFFSRNSKKLETESTENDVDNSSGGEELKVTPVSISELFRFSTKFELLLDFIGLVCAAAAGAAQPLMTLLFGNLTQDFVSFGIVLNTSPNDAAKISAAAAAFRHSASLDATYLVFIGVGIFVCTYIYMATWVYTGEVNARRVRENYLRAILRQEIAYFDKVGAGEVATRIQTDTHLVQQGISEKVALIVSFLSAFVTGFVLAYARSWRLALALSSMLPCIGLAGAIMNKAVSKYLQLSLKHIAEGGSLAEEVIATIRTAQAFGTQKTLSGLYDNHVDKSLRVNMKGSIYHGVALGVMFFVIYAGYALAFDLGITLLNENLADAGIVVNVMLSILIGSFSLAMLAPELQALTNARGAAAKLYATIDRVPEIDSADPGGFRPGAVDGEISLHNVQFSYPSRSNIQVLKGLSITFRAGKTAALVGASGSGKSTIISLVERFYDPGSGALKLDGVNIKDLNLKWLRSQIGLVSQEPTLFATTIRGNVEHGLIGTRYENASEEEKLAFVKEACIKANADGFISKLPNGYDTMVGERGFLLSGGQKQRIAIARAIVSDPKILLLDEATSALDTQSEGVVQDALDKAAAGRTTIVIAHRLSTVKDADVIYVMGDGRLIEQGSHNELLSANGAYARLVQAQKLREADETSDLEPGEVSKTEDIEKAAREEVPLGRKNTSQSLSSEIIGQKQAAVGKEKKSDYSFPYLFKRMGKLVPEAWGSYFLGFLAAILTGTVYPAFGVVFAKAINVFSYLDPHERRVEGDRNALYLFIIAILSSIAMSIQIYSFSAAASRLTARLRTLSFKAILRQDIEYFDKEENSTGALTASLSENPQKVNGLAGITLGAIVQSCSTIITGAVLGLIFIWKVALVGIACIPAVISTGYIRLRVVVMKDQTNKKAHEESAQLACEAAGAIRTVASLTREDDCCNLYSQSLEEPLRQSNRTAVWSNALYALSQAMAFFVIALVFWYGAVLVSNLEFSSFHFFVGLMSTTFGAIQAGNVFTFVPDMSSAQGAASDIVRLLDSVPEIDAESDEGQKVDGTKSKGHIRIDRIHFRYPTRPAVRVLRDFSVEVQPGTYIALVGASGCGKSTIIQMLERFYDPLAGEIYLDGELITSLNVQEYRKQIALVSQEPTLYAGTIRFNILLGAIKPTSEVTQEEIEAACRDANILDFIESLPDGFDTEVGGKGSQLSGGQKQRIAIARALLRNPKVLLLDEATSALDSTSEKVVQDALDRAAKGRTTIAIAHRLSTIQNADCIYFIKEGCVSESGTHDQLLNEKGDYYEYVQLQALSKRD